jgi:hypothetical protein
MLFMLESQTRPGVTREQMARHLNQRLKPGAWDVIRHGVVSNVLYKTGEEVGFFALLNAPSLLEAEALVGKAVESEGLFETRVVAVNQFPHFDSL